MKHKKAWEAKDNSNEWLKAELRRQYLPPKARVLDLFCGSGRMHELVYKNRAAKYHGLDKKKIHDPSLCTLINNTVYIASNDISTYDTFDLDDYGSPWKQMYLILRKHPGPEVTVFVTDGLVLRQKTNQQVTKFVSATERIPQKMNIPGLNRFYVDIFATMLLDIERRYNWKTEKAVYAHNERRSVYYWALKLRKTEQDEEKQRKRKKNKDNRCETA